MQEVFAFAAGCLSVLTLLAFLFRRALRELREFTTWWRKFQRDWDGEPEEPGRARVPGVMERLNRMDGELQRNGGNSLKDKVCDTDDRVRTFEHRLDTIEVRQREIMRKVRAS